MPFWKRALDLCIVCSALLFLLPVVVFLAVCIRLTSKGPILFSQKRSGHLDRPFLLHKFRTLEVSADPTNADISHLNERDGPAFKIENDPRATKVGRWLRASGLDELPQFWNVLRGDMSLVGPRPLPLHEMAACSDWHRDRLKVKPGLTCFWQLRDQDVSFDEWMTMDLRYVQSLSFLLDLKLILKTPIVMARRLLLFGKTNRG